LIGFECLLVGFIVVGFKRSRTFTKAWLEETFGRHHFEELTKAGHPEANSVGPAKGGYPDCGNGVYSQKLTYKQWHDFNLAVRCHMNFIEYVTPAIVMILIGGMQYPVVTMSAGVAFFVARIIYTIGYSINAAYRVPGFMINMLSIMVLLCTSVLSVGVMYRKMNPV